MLPSYYLSKMNRKQADSEQMRGELDGAQKQLLGSLDVMTRLQDKLKAEQTAKDTLAAKTAREDALLARNEGRQDARFAVEDTRADRKAQLEEAALRRAEAEAEYKHGRDVAEDERAEEKDRVKRVNDELEGGVRALRAEGVFPITDDEWLTDRARNLGTTKEVLVGEYEKQEREDADRSRKHVAEDESRASAAANAKDASARAWAGLSEQKRHNDATLALAKANLEHREKPSVAAAQSVTEIDNALGQATKLARDKGQIETGPIAALRNSVAQSLGIDTPEVTSFRANVGEQLATYIKNISGATVSESERADLLKNVPTMSDNGTAFVAKLDRVIGMLESKRRNQIRALEAAGKDTSGLAPVVDPDVAHADGYFGG